MSRGTFANSAVWRMRLALIIICLFIVAALTASAGGLFNIRHAQSVLRNGAIPTLERVEAVNARLLSLEQVIATLRTIDEQGSFDRAVTDAEALTHQIAVLSTEESALVELTGQLQTALGMVKEISIARFANFAEARELRAAVAQHQDLLTQSIEASVVSVGTDLETSLFDSTASDLSQNLILGVGELNALNHLGLTSEKIRDAVQTLPLVRNDVEIGSLKERLAFNLRSFVSSLMQLSRGPGQAELAGVMNRLRESLLGEAGLVALEQVRIEQEAEFGNQLQELEEIISRTAGEVTAGVSYARTGIRETAASVDRVVDDTIMQLGVLSIVILALTGATVVLLFERQIISRMKSLSGSVREIATGNIETKVHVRGNDEFGDMARALEAFKTNTKELHRSNAELSRFAYAASHDLRSPLRAIRDLAQWTIEDSGDGLPDHCRENLELLLSRVDRLADLLAKLLEYSRVGREDASVDTINLADVPRDILDLLGAGDRFTVDVTGDLAPVDTFEAPLRQILLNLISNAVKHHDRETGAIAMDVRHEARRLVISVSDDGPGIPPEFQERIFGLFEMLKSRDEVEGSGMGLAIIRKQLECQDGKISVISDPANGRGTTFVFDWPIYVSEVSVLTAA